MAFISSVTSVKSLATKQNTVGTRLLAKKCVPLNYVMRKVSNKNAKVYLPSTFQTSDIVLLGLKIET